MKRRPQHCAGRPRQTTRRLQIQRCESRQMLAADVLPTNDDFHADFEVVVDQFQDEYQFDLIANAKFPAGYTGPRQVTLISETARGSDAEISVNGQSVLYRTENNLAGKDSFTFIVDNQFSATATINVSNPLASDVYEVVQNSGTTDLPVLANDFLLRRPNSFEGIVSTQRWAPVREDARITHVLDDDADEVAISADGRSLLFTPDEDRAGPRYFRYVVDGRFEQFVQVYVQRPVVNDSVVADVDGGTHTFDVLLNDEYRSVLSNERIHVVDRVTSITQGDNGGTVAIDPAGTSVQYTPAAGFVGTEQFEYVADNKHSATVMVHVTQPVRDDRFTVYFDSTHALDVLQNDFASGVAQNNTVTSVSPSALGATVAIDAAGRILYTPPDDLELGSYHADSLQYTVNDQYTATVNLSIQSPVVNDFYQFDQRAARELRVLDNDHFGVDYLGPGLITNVSAPTGGGTVRIGSDGRTIQYQPGRLGESFTYTVDDRFTATVTMNTISRLAPDTMVADQNGAAVTVNVLANDFPSYANSAYGLYQGRRALGVDRFSEQGGVVAVTSDGQISYVPPANFVGRDTFTYSVDNFHFQTVTVHVIRRTADDVVRVAVGSQDNALNVLANDILGADYTGTGLITDVKPSTAGGQVSIAPDGHSLIYTPAPGFIGEDSFVYTMDGQSRATVTVSVTDQNQSALSGFDSTQQFREFVLEQAVERYQYQFGTLDYDSYPYDTDERSLNTASGFPTAADSPQFSETNVQVAGVDEHDIVETDGFYIYTLRGNELTIVQSLPADELQVVSRTEIVGNPVGMYLSGDRVTVLSESTQEIYYPTYNYPRSGFIELVDYSPSIYPGPPQPSSTYVTVIDVSDRALPEVVGRTKFDGRLADSRRINDQVFVILKSDTVLPEPISISDNEGTFRFESEEQYRQRITENFASLMEATLPSYESFDGAGELVRGGPLLMPEDILHATPDVTTMTVVASINMAASEPGLSAVSGVMADASTKIFASATSLYVFNDTIETIENERWTGILKFDWNSQTGAIDFAATGQVPGRLLNQFSADELNEQLRLTTEISNSYTGNHSGDAETAVFVLEDDGGVLEFVGSLQTLAVGENIKSVRYFGDRAFITTFDAVDPLTAIDLSDPAQPLALGHVLIPGFSSYMQFISPDRLLTIGTNTPTGFGGRAMVSLFDVSDLTSPHLIDQYNLPKYSTSEANNDHHAFGWFANHELLSVPTARYFSERYDADEDGYKEAYRPVREDELSVLHVGVDENGVEGIHARGQVSHAAEVQRSVSINDHIYSVGLDGVRVVQVDDANTVLDEVLFDWDLPIPNQPWMPIDHDEIGVAARNLLAQRGLQRSELFMVTQERRDGEVDVVLRAGGEHFRVRGTDASDLALMDETFRFSENLQFNSDNPYDVNNDGLVTALDALIVINELNARGEGALVVDQVLRQVASNTRIYTDTNADGRVSAVDALRIVNELVRRDQTTASSETLPPRFDDFLHDEEEDLDALTDAESNRLF